MEAAIYDCAHCESEVTVRGTPFGPECRRCGRIDGITSRLAPVATMTGDERRRREAELGAQRIRTRAAHRAATEAKAAALEAGRAYHEQLCILRRMRDQFRRDTAPRTEESDDRAR